MILPDLTLSVGQIRISPLFWSLFFAFIVSSFSVWKKLKEDYKEDEIFGMTLFILLCSLLFAWAPVYLLDSIKFSLFSSFFGAVTAVVLWSFRFKVNTWEILDALAFPLTYFLLLGGLGEFLKTGDFWEFEFSVAGILALLLFDYSKKKYRSFSWYKSGKIGFLFWETTACVFLLLSILAFLRGSTLYLERIIYIAIFLGSLGVIYYRSGRVLKNDITDVFKRKK